MRAIHRAAPDFEGDRDRCAEREARRLEPDRVHRAVRPATEVTVLCQARAQPANLTPVIDFVFGDVEPRPVRIPPWSDAQWRLEPRHRAPRERAA